MFANRRLAIATMHQKERVIAPLLEKNIHVKCEVPNSFNSDQFGTFSGEIDRIKPPLETLRQKCQAAIKLTNCSLAFASEGSFGAHPFIPFAQADDELVMLLDVANDIEIVGRKLSTDLNFGSSKVHNLDELKQFSIEKQFPSHGLILKSLEQNEILKDFNDWEELSTGFKSLSKGSKTVLVETDLRAMNNPTRMKVIEAATIDLIQKINSLCPNCSTPGFSIVDSGKGLPCSQCNFPTRSTLFLINGCVKCDYTEKHFHPNGQKFEEPMFCDNCNP